MLINTILYVSWKELDEREVIYSIVAGADDKGALMKVTRAIFVISSQPIRPFVHVHSFAGEFRLETWPVAI